MGVRVGGAVAVGVAVAVDVGVGVSGVAGVGAGVPAGFVAVPAAPVSAPPLIPPPVAGAIPWFKAHRGSRGTPLIFGHWASLGLWIEDDVMALDSGCVWNGSLTAVRIEDRAVFSVSNRREDE